jgi:hypothetical protein
MGRVGFGIAKSDQLRRFRINGVTDIKEPPIATATAFVSGTQTSKPQFAMATRAFAARFGRPYFQATRGKLTCATATRNPVIGVESDEAIQPRPIRQRPLTQTLSSAPKISPRFDTSDRNAVTAMMQRTQRFNQLVI